MTNNEVKMEFGVVVFLSSAVKKTFVCELSGIDE